MQAIAWDLRSGRISAASDPRAIGASAVVPPSAGRAARWCGAICVRPGVDFRALNAVAGVAVVPAGLPVCFPLSIIPGLRLHLRTPGGTRGPFQVKPQVALPLTTE